MLSFYLKDSYAFIVPPVLGFFVLTGISVLSLVRGGGRATNVLLAAICFMGALINADVALINIIPDKDLAVRIDRFTYVVFVFSLPVYIQFVHSFLGLHRRRWLEAAAYGASLVFLVLTPTDLFISGLSEFSFGYIARAGKAFHVFSLAAALTLAYCLITLYRAMEGAGDNARRNRIRYIFWGLGLSSLLIGLNILPVSGVPFYPLGNFSFIPAVVLAFGVLKYDLLDMGAVIRRGVVYFTLTAVLTVVYFLLISALNLLALKTGWERTILLPFLLALLMVFLFNPVRERVQVFINRLFFRDRYDYRKLLRSTSADLSTILDLDALGDLIVTRLRDALQVSHVLLAVPGPDGASPRLYLRTAEGGPEVVTPDVSSRHPLFLYLSENPQPFSVHALDRLPGGGEEAVRGFFRETAAEMVVPMVTKGRVIALVVLGPKLSGELFVDEDVELLATVANQGATALQNARLYGELQELNRELERKVEERTADLRRALEEKERTQEQLIRSESLAAIGQLVAGTAHELNNPLAGAASLIQTNLETIAGWEAAGEERDEVLDDLRFSLKELKRAAEIVRSLLDLSRQTQTYVEAVDMNVVLDDALRVLYNQFKRAPVAIVKRYDPALPPVEGNFANLGQVFINVVKNALQALPPEGGTIELTTKYDERKDAVVVSCRDTGCGIPPGRLQDIFKPFFTTKPTGQGTGLGLYISHEIVRRHGGEVKVESEPGRGTDITVTIPCRRERI